MSETSAETDFRFGNLLLSAEAMGLIDMTVLDDPTMIFYENDKI